MHTFSVLSGWLALIVAVTETFTFIARKWEVKSLHSFRGKHHQLWGKILIVLAILHSTVATKGSFSGLLSLLLAILLLVSFQLRKRIGAKWLSLHRGLALTFALMLTAHLLSVLH